MFKGGCFDGKSHSENNFDWLLASNSHIICVDLIKSYTKIILSDKRLLLMSIHDLLEIICFHNKYLGM